MDKLAPSTDVLLQGISALQRMLGEDWDVAVQPDQSLPVHGGDMGWDAVVRITSRHDSMFTELLVDVRDRLTPKDVAGYLGSTALLVRQLSHHTRLVVFAPWISPKTQEELRRREIGYLDLTGNVSLRVPRPAIVLHTQGADRAPVSHRPPSNKPLLTGARAGRLVRLLADVIPPYRATDLAKRSGLSLPYVSRLLDSLDDQLLIERDGRLIVRVNWQELLRTRAHHLDLVHHSSPVGMLAPNGIPAVINHLAASDGRIAGTEVLVTGSYAARTIAPVAVGGQLMLYTLPGKAMQTRIAHELNLIPVPEAADVLLLSPWDLSVWQRSRKYDSYWQVGLSQLVLDCLSGPGRLPAEGEKVLEYMAANEHAWRLDDLSDADDQSVFRFGPEDRHLF
ncbi:helix-turn-helix domain-containing protein [Streptomyces nodosus]|uniref:helix-turn-helix domain-containing protein n=1 Tax=Streptomyces nodosus TaxID=40318 RepID=UPI00382E1495